jgi:phosphatidylethanolamine-binding protein (PEBP) family uncharacterized protein
MTVGLRSLVAILALALTGASCSGSGAVNTVSPVSPTSPTGTISPSSTPGPSTFTITSPVGSSGGTLPAEYTCDGGGSTIALSWTNVPSGTQEFALLMTTLPGDGTTKWNWVLYGIPGSTTGLARDSRGIGTLGVGSDGPSAAYQPPCSQGPGAKIYTFTIYALSASPRLAVPANQVTGAVVTSAISSITLGSASLNLSYTRPR